MGVALGAGVAIGPFMAVAVRAVAGWRAAYWVTALGALLGLGVLVTRPRATSDPGRPSMKHP